VVAAGPKAILDTPKTLETLETLGVPVIAFGQDALPAFWSSSSPILAPQRLDTADEIATAHKAVTPFLLNRIFELTGGRSLTTNIALVRNNARLAARIACALATT